MNVGKLIGIFHKHTLDELEQASILGTIVGALCGMVFVFGVVGVLAGVFG
jgi:hypothetical protein